MRKSFSRTGRRQRRNNSALQSRRSFLQTSVLGGGLGLGLADLLRLRAASGSPGVADTTPPDTAVIQLWLGGGISQFESWDPKPDAPSEVRGPWNPITTALPGVQFCELLPKQARLADKFAVLRSVHHKQGSHAQGTTLCATGKVESGHPSSGAIAAREHGPNGFGLPAYVQLKPVTTANPTFPPIFDARYLGGSYDPFEIFEDPSEASFRVPNLELASGLTIDRLEDRRGLLAGFDRFNRNADRARSLELMDHFQQASFELLTGPRTRTAFDLSREAPNVRARYGMHRWGQSALLARRLVEAGVTFVTINTAPDCIFWDIHGGKAGTVTDHMKMACFHLDTVVSALVEDIHQRGLNKKVLVLVWGEFGRTPTINKRAGRDHWPQVGSLLMAGGGLRVGQVIGASDNIGGLPADRPLRPEDVLATVYRHLGIDPRAHLENLDGQPIPILPDGEVIVELL